MYRTVGELVDILLQFPQGAFVSIYDEPSEDGGMFVSYIRVQRRDDDNSHLYYKSDHPFSDIHNGTYVDKDGQVVSIDEIVTIVGA